MPVVGVAGATAGAAGAGAGSSLLPLGLGLAAGGLFGGLFGGGEDGDPESANRILDRQEYMLSRYQPVYQQYILPFARRAYLYGRRNVLPTLKRQVKATKLPAHLQVPYTRQTEAAGERLGEYFAGRGMLDSGAAATQQRKFEGENIDRYMSLLSSHQQQGTQGLFQAMGLAPSSPITSVPQVQQTQQSSGLDFGALGGLFAQGLSKLFPSAAPTTVDPTLVTV